MVRICLDARLYSASGIGTYLRGLIPALSGYSLTLLYSKKDKALLKDYEKIEMESPIYSLQEQVELPAKIPPCDLFFSPHFNVPFLPIRAKRRLTCVHDVNHLVHFKNLNLLQKIYAKMAYNAAFVYSDMVVTVSNFSKCEILSYATIKPKTLKMVYPTCDLSHFYPREKGSVRKRYNLPEEFVLFIGTEKPHKNLKKVLEVTKALDLPLVMIGPISAKNGLVFPYIEREDLPAFYSEAKFLAFPSFYEGFGTPPIEAMACGCPVLTSNLASMPEVCGDAAEFVNPYHLQSIMHGMEEIQKEERRSELIQKGFERVQRYSLEKTRAQYVQLIEEALQ